MELEVLVPGHKIERKLGSPSVLSDTEANTSASGGSLNGSSSSNLPRTSNSNITVNMNGGDTSLAGVHTHPISSLSPYHNK